MTKGLTRCLLPALLLLVLPLAVQATDTSAAAVKQASTAAAHAGVAFGATDLKTAQAHLHHVVNCLVGSAGRGFDAKAGDPCKGQAQGAIVDAQGDAAAEARLHTALAEAEAGLEANTVDAAHAATKKAMGALQGA